MCSDKNTPPPETFLTSYRHRYCHQSFLHPITILAQTESVQSAPVFGLRGFNKLSGDWSVHSGYSSAQKPFLCFGPISVDVQEVLDFKSLSESH